MATGRTPDRPPTPDVTVGIPVYNGGTCIRRALDSLLRQTYPQTRLLISDNCSSDETETICREYTARHPNVSYFRQEQNIGAVENFIFLARQAETPYFMWAAHDDEWHPNFISALLSDLETHPESAVVMSSVSVYNDKDGELLETKTWNTPDHPNPNEQSWLETFKGMLGLIKYNYWIYGLFRTDYLKKALQSGMPKNVYAGDRLFMVQIALSTHLRLVPDILYYRYRPVKSKKERFPDFEQQMVSISLSGLLKGGLELARLLWNSPLVPPDRKLLIPWAVCYYYWARRGMIAEQIRKKRRRSKKQAV